ncbi:hypothetical protein SCLCIDRAFT_1043707 [Scleroderma citrinum Foug A]|uniref:Uncharacterized protein n=1 Tax=Scleroderma citrinum Foug A TaxID=1036808 RepID=A0A0C3A312_9AGAM|nr:hypothetical protein SCLCIDRAFT_1043707 [Scleroderma citrinum Foug A]
MLDQIWCFSMTSWVQLTPIVQDTCFIMPLVSKDSSLSKPGSWSQMTPLTSSISTRPSTSVCHVLMSGLRSPHAGLSTPGLTSSSMSHFDAGL